MYHIHLHLGIKKIYGVRMGSLDSYLYAVNRDANARRPNMELGFYKLGHIVVRKSHALRI